MEGGLVMAVRPQHAQLLTHGPHKPSLNAISIGDGLPDSQMVGWLGEKRTVKGGS